MSIETLSDSAGLRVLRATGEVDVATAPPLLVQVPQLAAGARAVVLDTTQVSFFDSSGVRVLDRLARTCGAAGVPLRVVAPPGSATRRVLEMVGMVDGLAEDDLDSAVAAVRRG
jgi:anti-sigma B factor antagonist